MPFTTLISASELAANLDDPSWLVIDCRFDLRNTSAGEGAYAAGHIPGAIYAHLDRDLSGVKTGSNGRHPLPAPDALARTFGRFGIEGGTQVVAYDQDSGMYASRLWWMLRWVGHDRVAVLDGGFGRWVADTRPTSVGIETRPPQTFTARLREDLLATADEVEALVNRPGWQLVDARAPERFRGAGETLDPVAGHIPGAHNHFYQSNLDEGGLFRSPADLARRFRESLGDVPPTRAVCYCGSGVTACHDLLALEHAGLSGARLYAGSWSEWCANPRRAVERTGDREP